MKYIYFVMPLFHASNCDSVKCMFVTYPWTQLSRSCISTLTRKYDIQVSKFARRFAELGIVDVLVDDLRGVQLSSSSLVSACNVLKAVAVTVCSLF